MRGNAHVRFGGRERETESGRPNHRAFSRPYMSPRTPAAATSSTTSSAVDTSSDRRSSPPTSRSSTGARSSRERRASPPSSIASPSRAPPSTSMPTRGARRRSERGETTRKSEGQNHAALHGRLHPPNAECDPHENGGLFGEGCVGLMSPICRSNDSYLASPAASRHKNCRACRRNTISGDRIS